MNYSSRQKPPRKRQGDTTTASFRAGEAGEYALKLDEPMSAVVDGSKPCFRLENVPKNAKGRGSLRVKAGGNGPKSSVAGSSKAVDQISIYGLAVVPACPSPNSTHGLIAAAVLSPIIGTRVRSLTF